MGKRNNFFHGEFYSLKKKNRRKVSIFPHLQSVFQILRFHLHKFNQMHIENIPQRKNSRKSQKAKLEFAMSETLYCSLYTVFTTIYTAFTLYLQLT